MNLRNPTRAIIRWAVWTLKTLRRGPAPQQVCCVFSESAFGPVPVRELLAMDRDGEMPDGLCVIDGDSAVPWPVFRRRLAEEVKR